MNHKAYEKLLAWTEGVLLHYAEAGLTPEPGWEQAHHPAPTRLGDATVWLTREHHAIHGVLQSEAYEMPCTSNRYTSNVEGTEWEERHRYWVSKLSSQGGANSRKNGWAPGHKEKAVAAAKEVWCQTVIATELATGKTWEFPSQKEACHGLGLNPSAVSCVVNGKRSSTQGYHLQRT